MEAILDKSCFGGSSQNFYTKNTYSVCSEINRNTLSLNAIYTSLSYMSWEFRIWARKSFKKSVVYLINGRLLGKVDIARP